jgi:hypothetical protein
MFSMLATEVARHRAEVGGSGKGKVDEAWDFLQAHGADSPDAQEDELKAIRRKIDWAILPLLFVAYMLQFVDKALINVCLEAQAIPFPKLVQHVVSMANQGNIVCRYYGLPRGPEAGGKRFQ